MYITQREAVQMYAKMCRAWYGRRARRVVLKTIQQMRTRGDQSGVKAWEQVAAELDSEKSQQKRSF